MIFSLAGEVAGGWGKNRSIGRLAIPDHAMGGAIGRLVPSGEQGVDLVVGPVDRAGRPCFLFALAAQLESGLDKRLCLGLPNLGIHWNISSFPGRRRPGNTTLWKTRCRTEPYPPTCGRALSPPTPRGRQVMLSDILGQQPVLQDQMMKERCPQQHRVRGELAGQPAVLADAGDHARPQAVKMTHL